MKIKYLFSGIEKVSGFRDAIVPFLQSDIIG